MKIAAFFNAINGDRAYDANDFALYMKKYFTTGVFDGDLTVSPASGMNITIQPGSANIEGYRFDITEPENLSFSIGDSNYTRIDNVVIRLDKESRTIDLTVVEGNPSSSPIAPTPTRTANIYDIVLYQIEIPSGTSEITKAMIKDTRFDETICGIVTGTVKQISTKELFEQYDAIFDNFLQHLKDELEENQAGNLQNQIDNINNEFKKVGYIDVDDNGNDIIIDKDGNQILNRILSEKAIPVGKWIDGRTIYRQVVHIPNCDQVKNTGVIKTGINWDIVTDVEAFYINTNGSQVFFNSYVTPEAFVRIVPSSTKGNFDISAGSSYTGNPLDVYIIVEFTKDES